MKHVIILILTFFLVTSSFSATRSDIELESAAPELVQEPELPSTSSPVEQASTAGLPLLRGSRLCFDECEWREEKAQQSVLGGMLEANFISAIHHLGMTMMSPFALQWQTFLGSLSWCSNSWLLNHDCGCLENLRSWISKYTSEIQAWRTMADLTYPPTPTHNCTCKVTP